MQITIELYGFQKTIEITKYCYQYGKVSCAILRPFKPVIQDDCEIKLIDINNYQLDFYKCDDEIWRPQQY